MKLVVLVLVILAVGVFCSAELGDEWDSFSGNDSRGSSVEVNVDVGGSNDANVEAVGSGGEGRGRYTLDFYIALGVGAFGVLIVVIFLYFFLRKPKNRWERKTLK
ncbi:MAG: hypothetical protein V1889_00725 [archaeon]